MAYKRNTRAINKFVKENTPKELAEKIDQNLFVISAQYDQVVKLTKENQELTELKINNTLTIDLFEKEVERLNADIKDKSNLVEVYLGRGLRQREEIQELKDLNEKESRRLYEYQEEVKEVFNGLKHLVKAGESIHPKSVCEI